MLFIIYLSYKSYIWYRKKKRKIDRREQLICTEITRNVREVTNSERVRQTYQSVSKHSTLLHYFSSIVKYGDASAANGVGDILLTDPRNRVILYASNFNRDSKT